MLAAFDKAWFAALALGAPAITTALIGRAEYAKAMQVWRDAVQEYVAIKQKAVIDRRIKPH